MSTSRGMARVLTKLESSFNAGDYYEAHQMYRTLYHRYSSQKKYDECLDLLYTGVLKFLNSDQYTTGADLGILIVDTLQKAEMKQDYLIWIERLGLIIKKIGSTIVERETLLIKAVKWSSDVSNIKFGHPTMHKLIAQIMWSEGNLEQSRYHFLLSKDGLACGQMLIQLSQKGLSTELDLFIAQVILQQLCLKETSSAMTTFLTYTKEHPKLGCTEPPFTLPLLNFVFFLLKTVETGKLAMFKALCELYKPSIDRDPLYEKYLTKIGQVFFNVPEVQQRNNVGFFGDLLNQFFQDNSEEIESSNTVTSSTALYPIETDLD